MRIFDRSSVTTLNREAGKKESISGILSMMRNGKALKWYEQFYDAREIIDLDVRPNLGTSW